MKKVLHIITSSGKGGAERMLLKLVRNRRKVEDVVLCLKKKKEFGKRIESAGVRFYSLDNTGGYLSPASIVRIRNIIREEKPDLIQGWMYHSNIIASLITYFMGEEKSVIWNIRHSINDLGKESLSRRCIIKLGNNISRYADGMVYNSQISRKQHVKYGYNNDNSYVIPNGFDCEKYKYKPSLREKFRNKIGATDEEFIVGHVGSYQPMKDHGNFLKACEMCNKIDKSISFIMVGKNVKRSNQKLRAQISNVNIDKRLILLGEQSNIPEIMNGIDLLVLSSAWGEAFPNVLGEAMACKTPCISTDVGDAKYIIGDAGKIVPPEKPASIATSIKWFIDLGEVIEYYRRISRKRIKNNFNINEIVEKYTDLHRSYMY